MRGLPRRLAAHLRAAVTAGSSAAARAAAFTPEAVCRTGKGLQFLQQLAFVRDPTRYKVACCSRRAGKTVACAVILLTSALTNPDSENLYLTLSRVSGKRIVWKKLLRLNRDFKLGGKPDRTELTLTFPNGSVIYVGGAKDESEIEKYRGPAYKTVVIDEAQSFRAHIQQLIDDIVEPMMVETKGTIILIGTPAKTKAGYFYEACLSASPELLQRMALQPANDNASAPPAGEEEVDGGLLEGVQWSVHHWTIHDNPFIEDVEDELAKLRARRRWSKEHPTYQREYLGRWVTEHDALVYKYDPERNGYDPARLRARPEDVGACPDFSGPEWRFVHGVDQGFHDADALGTLAYRPDEPWIWLLPDEEIIRREGSAALVARAKARWEKYKGRTVGFVWDTGGGGLKSAVDAQEQGVPVEAADKKEKVAGIDEVNDDLLAGVLRFPLNSQCAADSARVTWDPKARGLRVGGTYHTDALDLVTYAHRRIPRGALISMDEWKRRQEIAADPLRREADERRARISARGAERERQKKQRKGGRGFIR